MVTIYALCDSREPDPIARVRYIGQTIRPLAARLRQHWNDPQETYRKRWMRSVAFHGGDVLIEALAVVERADADVAEQAHIIYARGLGSRLTNTTDGGIGPNGRHVKGSTKRKMRAAALARWNRPGQREDQSVRHLSTETNRKLRRMKNAAKLTPDQVLAIRASGRTKAELAADYGVAVTTIKSVLYRHTWADLYA